jgi:hypothetical protein
MYVRGALQLAAPNHPGQNRVYISRNEWRSIPTPLVLRKSFGGPSQKDNCSPVRDYPSVLKGKVL